MRRARAHLRAGGESNEQEEKRDKRGYAWHRALWSNGLQIRFNTMDETMKAAFLALLVAAAGSVSAQAQAPTSASWTGRWYVQSAAVCKTKDGEGLITYSVTDATGYESRCKIASATVQGTKTLLKLRCRAEGQTYTEQETLEVVNGKLRRTVTVEGKARTFDYSRCP